MYSFTHRLELKLFLVLGAAAHQERDLIISNIWTRPIMATAISTHSVHQKPDFPDDWEVVFVLNVFDFMITLCVDRSFHHFVLLVHEKTANTRSLPQPVLAPNLLFVGCFVETKPKQEPNPLHEPWDCPLWEVLSLGHLGGQAERVLVRGGLGFSFISSTYALLSLTMCLFMSQCTH